jgi:carbon monoxide dehydrogenase subunit G
MKLTHTVAVQVDIDRTWEVPNDIAQVTLCFPGATVQKVGGESFNGTVRVKLGAIALTCRGTAKFIEQAPARHRAVLEANARDTRGSGTVAATTTLGVGGDGTIATLDTDLNITGKTAQFGRSVFANVGDRVIGQFGACLADALAAETAERTPSTTKDANGRDEAAAEAASDLTEKPHKREARSGEPPLDLFTSAALGGSQAGGPRHGHQRNRAPCFGCPDFPPKWIAESAVMRTVSRRKLSRSSICLVSRPDGCSVAPKRPDGRIPNLERTTGPVNVSPTGGDGSCEAWPREPGESLSDREEL